MGDQQNLQNSEFLRDRKIFVGGLAWRTNANDLRAYCEEHYGPVIQANVVTQDLRSKGYGFVVFGDIEAATKACELPHPKIHDRETNINLAHVGAKKTNHASEKGIPHQAGPLHQFHQPGRFNQRGFLIPPPPPQQCFPFANQYPAVWDVNTGQYNYMYVPPFYHQYPPPTPMFHYGPPFVGLPPNPTKLNKEAPIFVPGNANAIVQLDDDEHDDDNEEVVADVVHKDNKEEVVVMEPSYIDLDRGNSNDQEEVVADAVHLDNEGEVVD